MELSTIRVKIKDITEEILYSINCSNQYAISHVSRIIHNGFKYTAGDETIIYPPNMIEKITIKTEHESA